jgi:acetate kinase
MRWCSPVASANTRRQCAPASPSGWHGPGLSLYPAANERHATRIHARDSKIEVLVVPTNEEWMIGHHAVNLLGL